MVTELYCFILENNMVGRGSITKNNLVSGSNMEKFELWMTNPQIHNSTFVFYVEIEKLIFSFYVRCNS